MHEQKFHFFGHFFVRFGYSLLSTHQFVLIDHFAIVIWSRRSRSNSRGTNDFNAVGYEPCFVIFCVFKLFFLFSTMPLTFLLYLILNNNYFYFIKTFNRWLWSLILSWLSIKFITFAQYMLTTAFFDSDRRK